MAGAVRVLVLDAAVRGGLAAIVHDGVVLAERATDAARGVAATLPGFAASLMGHRLPDLIAVTVGPGSFTGIRAALSLAHGLALAGAVPLVGVTVPEALAHGSERCPAQDDGDAAASGSPGALGIAAAALSRHAGILPPLAVQPVYAEGPQARTVAQRPPPV